MNLWQDLPAPPLDLGPGFWPSPVLERTDLTQDEPLWGAPEAVEPLSERGLEDCANTSAVAASWLLRALYLALCGVCCAAAGALFAWCVMGL